MGIEQFEPTIVDFDYQGTINTDGAITELWGKEALDQSIKLWIASFSGESIREPTRGGYLIQQLVKPMREVSIESMEMTIRDGIYQDFKPYLHILGIKITPNYEKRYWEIYLDVYSPDLKIQTVVDEKIKGTVT